MHQQKIKPDYAATLKHASFAKVKTGIPRNVISVPITADVAEISSKLRLLARHNLNSGHVRGACGLLQCAPREKLEALSRLRKRIEKGSEAGQVSLRAKIDGTNFTHYDLIIGKLRTVGGGIELGDGQKTELKKFCERPEGKLELKGRADGYFIVEDGGYLLLEHNIFTPAHRLVCDAIKLLYASDIARRGSTVAAWDYLVRGAGKGLKENIHLAPDMHEILGMLAESSENPKLGVAISLAERSEGKRMLVLCEGKELKDSLGKFLSSANPAAEVSSSPKEAFKSGRHFDMVVIYSNNKPNWEAAKRMYGETGCEIFVITCKSTADSSKHYGRAMKSQQQEIQTVVFQ